MMWLLKQDVYDEIQAARRSGMTMDAATRTELVAANRNNGRVRLEGRTAVIPIEGVLTPKPDFFAALFGGGNTTYESIQAGIAEANADDRVESIELMVNSPGGDVDGLFATMDDIRNATKPTRAVVTGRALSAAFGIATQADEIVATGRSNQFGSVGVATDVIVRDDRVSVASTEAPNKRPDLKTEEGRAVIREQLDATHELFAGAIAEGRKTTTKDVNKNYGRGAVVLAEKALEAGMIDGIGVANQQQTQAAVGGENGGEAMDKQTLLLNHPELYAAVKAEGVAEERGRVNAHLKLGETCGAMKTAVKAIQDGEALTVELQAEYISASVTNRTIVAREDDNPDTGEIPAVGEMSVLDAEVLREYEALTGEDLSNV